MEDLPYETFSVQLRAWGYRSVLIENIEVNEFNLNPIVTAHLAPETLHSLTIQVVDVNGRAVPDAIIYLTQLIERVNGQGNLQTGLRVHSADGKTDASGVYAAGNIQAGVYKANCSAENGALRGETIFDVTGTTRVTMPVEKSGKSIAYQYEFIDPAESGESLYSGRVHSFAVNPDGTPSNGGGFSQQGWHTIIAIMEGRTAFIDTIHIDLYNAPGNGMVIKAVLDQAGLISGSVEKPDGNPSAFDYLYVFPEAVWPLAREAWADEWKNLGAGLAQGARVDVDGSFVLDYLPEGAYVVALSETAYSDPVDVKPGYETGPVVLVRDAE